jgi:hypothetical protein
MNETTYKELQKRFTNKLNNTDLTGKRKEGYEEGILACKSILREIYQKENKQI